MLKKNSVFTNNFFIFLLILTISIGGIALYSVTTFRDYIFNLEKSNLKEKTEIFMYQFPSNSVDYPEVVDNYVSSVPDKATRITIINRNGVVLSDSIENPVLMDNHITRPEVVANINGKNKFISRYSDTLHQHMIYYSLPIMKNGEIDGFLRTAISVELLNRRVQRLTYTIIIISIILIILSVVISYFTASNISNRIKSIKEIAKHYSKGDFGNSLEEKGPVEIASLSKAINAMGASLQDRISATIKQKNRYKSMLESMREPVLRLNNDFIIEEINGAAETLFKQPTSQAKGHGLVEVTGNKDLLKFVMNAPEDEDQNEEIIRFYTGDLETHLQVHRSILYDGFGNKNGHLIVMNDLTERIRLEDMRKEFVANVSHELRTPTTAIQGYIETLINNDVTEEQLQKFLDVIYSNSTRLTSIIDDLLALAGLEKSEGTFLFEEFPVTDLISSAINVAGVKAEKKNIEIQTYSSDRHIINAHPLLAEQALTNLLVNAIKYSGENTRIEIKSFTNKAGTIIEVSDEGNGISEEDQIHIFDRFYRVDKARSRDQGGTGLGLSIVKRVMDIHGGEASVNSELNIGSVFRLFFPNR